MSDVVLFETSETESGATIATITINRPDKLNALNRAVLQGVEKRLGQARDAGARCVIMTGAGKAFVAGRARCSESPCPVGGAIGTGSFPVGVMALPRLGPTGDAAIGGRAEEGVSRSRRADGSAFPSTSRRKNSEA